MYAGILTGLLSVGALTGCNNNSRKATDEEIRICVYNGGYGTAWIQALAEEYEEKTGVKVIWKADQSILDRIQDQLENGADYDLYLSHGINWQSYAASGLLENLDDLYESTVEGTDGKTFAERCLEENLIYSKTEGEKEGEEHYYKVNYTQGAGGLIYNIDLFEEQGWSVPQTYAELQTLCQTIVDADITVGARDKLVPIAWSGAERQYYWDYIVFEWWAQLAGLDKVADVIKYMGPDSEGNLTRYSNGYEMYNPTTYYAEFKQAYQMWYDLIQGHKSYSMSGSAGASLLDAQSAFASGKAAMIPYAQWAKYEITNGVGADKLDFDIAMMKTPKVSASSQEVNYLVGYGDSIVMPSFNYVNKEGAKDFLRYMATYDACKTFVDKAEGAFLAFDYSDVDLGELLDDTYTKSIYDKLTECESFTLASTNPITYWTTDEVMPWFSNDYYYAAAMTGESGSDPTSVGNTMYNAAKTSWKSLLMQAGLPYND